MGWTEVLVGAIFAAAAGHFTITKLFPKIRDSLDVIIKDEKLVSGFLYVFIVYVWVFVFDKVFKLFGTIEGDTALKTLVAIFMPAIDVLLKILPYAQWLFAGILLLAGIKYLKK